MYCNVMYLAPRTPDELLHSFTNAYLFKINFDGETTLSTLYVRSVRRLEYCHTIYVKIVKHLGE